MAVAILIQIQKCRQIFSTEIPLSKKSASYNKSSLQLQISIASSFCLYTFTPYWSNDVPPRLVAGFEVWPFAVFSIAFFGLHWDGPSFNFHCD